ncbi:MAG: rhodanese-like domain-containing protein [Chthoniobacteraceae bacterium]|nr:rhodanese-like domain-containing protein [Chthoniobacteraceae bacterium]
MKTITVQELQKILAAGGPVDLIDVRTPAEYASVHVPEARLCQLDGLDCGEIIAGRKGDVHTPIYILCHSGMRARKAAAKFVAAGFEDAVVVEGGTQAWIDAGLPVERSAKGALPLDRQLQLVIGALVVTGVLLSRFVDPRWIWLSGLVGAGLLMAGATGFCPMRSLIALMPWNQKSGCCGGGSCCSR